MPRSIKAKTDQIELFQQRLYDLTQDEIDAGSRDEKGRMTCTVRSIAKEIGISPSTLSSWRRGKTTGIPQVDYLRKIADHYHVNVDWLAGTPGAERDPNTTLAATGLSAEAIENLISIHNMYDAPSQYLFGYDLLSQILSNPSFKQLVMAYMDLAGLADDIEKQLQFVESVMKSSSDSPIHDLRDFDVEWFIMQVENLEYGRYSILEACNNILDSLCISPVNNMVIRAKEAIRFCQKR